MRGQPAGTTISRLWGSRVDRRTQSQSAEHMAARKQRERMPRWGVSPICTVSFPPLSPRGAGYPHSGSLFHPWLILFGNGLRTHPEVSLMCGSYTLFSIKFTIKINKNNGSLHKSAQTALQTSVHPNLPESK